MELSSCTVPASINDESLESWQRIGCGGFGEIYRARHTKWKTDVAIKLLRYNDGSDSSLLQEADLMRHGGNPNVLRIFGVYVGCRAGHLPPTSGLVMEYMERGSVADLQRALDGPPPWPLAFRITHQIALGMNFLHQLAPPLLHLDLKPSNVLLDDSLNAKLTDFGLAKLARNYSSEELDQNEEVCGTTSYMPPEAFKPSYTPNFSSDVYSYGVLLWSVMTGKEPYHTPLSSLVRFRVSEGDRPDLGAVDSSQADGLSNLTNLTERCWDADHNQRPTFMECVNVTEEVYDLHKRKVPAAVYDTIQMMDNSDKISSSFKSLGITPNTSNALKKKSQHSVKTGPTPTQEKSGIAISPSKGPGLFSYRGPVPSRTNQKPVNGPHINHNQANIKQKLLAQRQFSTPGTIFLSNVTGVQIGNNNHMNINRPLEGQRHRHPTAPSCVSLSNSDQPPKQNPDHEKP